MIQIYSPENMDFESNGDMTLLPEECRIKAELNGEWVLEIEHPLDEEGRWKYIEEEAVLKVPSFLPEEQLFRISKPVKDNYGVTATAYPIFFDAAKDCFLMDVRPTNVNGQEALSAMCAPNAKYSAISDIAQKATSYYIRKNLLKAISGDDENSFLRRWGGEIIYSNYTISINERIGSDNGFQVRYGKNMDGLTQTIDMSNVITRIVPVAYNGHMLDGDAPWVDSPNINKYPTVYCREVKFDDVKLLEDASEDETGFATLEELQAELVRCCEQMFEEGCDQPNITLEVKVIYLANTEEYKDFSDLEKVSLGDDVYCYNKRLGITTKARCIQIIYDCIRKSVDEVVLGDYVPTIFDKTTSIINKVNTAIKDDGTVVAERVKGTLNAMETSLRLQSSAARKVDGRAFIIEDLDPESSLYGAMEAGTQGLRIAKKKDVENKWVWETAITAAGIVANAIVTGLLSDKTGENFWNLDTGQARFGSSTLIGNKTVGEIEEIVGKVEGGVEGNYFYIRYSANADGSGMTEEPADDTKYIGVCNTSSVAAPTDPEEYDWILVKGKDGEGGTPGAPGADGKTSYLHIKYSDDGKTFTKNHLSADIDQWQGGSLVYGSGKTKDFEIKEAGDSLTFKEAIKVVPGEKYTIKTNHSKMYIFITTYDSAGEYVSRVATGRAEYTYTIPSGVEYLGIYIFATGSGSAEAYSTYEELVEAFANDEIVPTMYRSDNVPGEELGAYIGTYVDFTEADSTEFDAYTWKKFTEDVDEELKEIRTLIEKNADNIKLCVTQTDYTGEKIVSLINLSPESVKIAAALIALEGVVTANESFRILTDGSAEATNLTVEKEIFTDILNVNSINNGQYQKTLISSMTIYVNATSGDDDQECTNGAVFKTLQGAINSIPKFMNGKTVNIVLQNDTTENVHASYFQSGRIHIYLSGHTLYGYFETYLSQYIYLYGGTKDGGGTDVKGNVHPSTGVSYSNYTVSVLYNNSGGFVNNVNVYGSDNVIPGTNGTLAMHGVNFAHVYLTAISLINAYQGFRANGGARLHINTSDGVVSDYAFYATSGSVITLASLAQAGASNSNKNTGVAYGGEVVYHNPTFQTGTVSSSGSTADTTVVEKTVTYTADKGNSVQKYGSTSAHWRSDNTPKVGEWDGNGDHVAFWFFGDDFENIANKNVTKIEITFTRNRGGNSAATTHNFYAHSYESQPSTVKPEYYTTKIGSASVATYATGKVTITDSNLISAIKSRKGICSIPPAQSSAYYSVMSGAMKVKFYYTE